MHRIAAAQDHVWIGLSAAIHFGQVPRARHVHGECGPPWLPDGGAGGAQVEHVKVADRELVQPGARLRAQVVDVCARGARERRLIVCKEAEVSHRLDELLVHASHQLLGVVRAEIQRPDPFRHVPLLGFHRIRGSKIVASSRVGCHKIVVQVVEHRIIQSNRLRRWCAISW